MLPIQAIAYHHNFTITQKRPLPTEVPQLHPQQPQDHYPHPSSTLSKHRPIQVEGEPCTCTEAHYFRATSRETRLPIQAIA